MHTLVSTSSAITQPSSRYLCHKRLYSKVAHKSIRSKETTTKKQEIINQSASKTAQRTMNSYLNSKNMLSILVVASLMCISTAFVIPTETSYRNGVNAPSYQSELSMSSSIMESPRHSFEDRMRDLVIGGRKKKTVIEEKSKLLPANMKIVTSLSDYKKVVGGERDRIVVVRFFAPWCKVRLDNRCFIHSFVVGSGDSWLRMN